jgi:hypothetical protein
MIENREVMKRTLPEVFSQCRILPVDDYIANLWQMLRSLSDASDPVLCVLTPGVYNSAYFEHSFLARQLGAELVEGRDLLVGEDECVYVRNVDGLKRVDVIYRRIDDEFLDPECFNRFSVYVPDKGWFDFDPTNNKRPDSQYVTTAWGRDYADVAPLRGVVFGGGQTLLKVAVDVNRIEKGLSAVATS